MRRVVMGFGRLTVREIHNVFGLLKSVLRHQAHRLVGLFQLWLVNADAVKGLMEMPDQLLTIQSDLVLYPGVTVNDDRFRFGQNARLVNRCLLYTSRCV